MKSKILNFKELIVWQKSIDMVVMIYKFTQTLPENEKFGIVAQIKRAAISVPSNIAEGYSRNSSGQYKLFLSYASGSTSEIETLLVLCQKLDMGIQKDLENIFKLLNEIQRMLNTISSRIKNR